MELKIFKKKHVSFQEMLVFLIKFIFYFDTTELYTKTNKKIYQKNGKDTLSLFDYCFYGDSNLDKIINIINCQSGGSEKSLLAGGATGGTGGEAAQVAAVAPGGTGGEAGGAEGKTAAEGTAQGPGGGPGRGQMTEDDIKERSAQTAKTLELNEEQAKKILAIDMDFYNKMQIERQKMRNMERTPENRDAMMEKMRKQRENEGRWHCKKCHEFNNSPFAPRRAARRPAPRAP